MAAPLDSHRIETVYNPLPPEYPLIKSYFHNIMGHEPTSDELLQFFAAKQPDPKNENNIRYIPRVESMLHALRNVAGGTNKFLSSLEDNGFVASFDGIKIALIDHNVNKYVADAVILGNLEIILKSANDVGLNCVVGMYSGDENIGLFAPNDPSSDSNELQEKFNKKLQENANLFYANPYFEDAKKAIEAVHHGEGFGLTAKYGSARDVYIYTPLIYREGKSPQKAQPDVKQAIGSVIDSTDGRGMENNSTTTPLLDYLKTSLNFKLDKILEYNLGLERIFPFELQVKKIVLLYSDIKKRIEENNENVYLIRFADILMKYTNKNHGHTKGDHHMIATANMMRRMLNDIDINQKDAEIYQHNGSFILACNQAGYTKIATALSDPVTFNQFYVSSEDRRITRVGQDPTMRANPFVVATTTVLNEDGKPETINFGSNNLENLKTELWDRVNKLQEAQIISETITSLYTSGIALNILNNLPDSVNHILTAFSLKLPNLEENINLSFHTLNFASLFESYYTLRPNNLNKLLRTLSRHHLLPINDFRTLKNLLKDMIARTS